ncbi:hypothetical protein PTQ19_10290 [Microbacterium esteraromaticum]|uniref:hypothetical protein n=1 Tax=Microbacterium esteraromaticum TaxID=57043 RepID=UPI0023676D38|nr:hypothetical protein [Microbacterium esteraromaticum]WDH77910.1 hypothetical protein PTQ19_10290 [Microbacterium esteraromaticum]
MTALAAGQSVTFQGRPSTVVAVKGDIVTISSYAGVVMIGADHPDLSTDLADWRRARLEQASARGEVVKLTGPRSISTPWES